MLFSKSFGYAVRGVLYISLMQDEKTFVQAEEIAHELGVPRHFMSKILKKLVKAGVLSSAKGKAGGFATNGETKQVSLFFLMELTDGTDLFHKCSLRLQECSAVNPCPLHNQVEGIRQRLQETLSATKVGDLLHGDKAQFVKSIATALTEH